MERTPKNTKVARDRDVRLALHQKVLMDHHGDENTLVLDELGLRHGACRVDIAVVNSFLHGYEIKSDADTLYRLPNQIIVYGLVLDRVTLVVGKTHIQEVTSWLPDWWGIKIVSVGPRGGITFESYRPASMNPNIDPVALSELLWRSEVVSEIGVRSCFLIFSFPAQREFREFRVNSGDTIPICASPNVGPHRSERHCR